MPMRDNDSDTMNVAGCHSNRRGRGRLAEGRKRVKLTRGVVQEDRSHQLALTFGASTECK